jgi:hypothetical protein
LGAVGGRILLVDTPEPFDFVDDDDDDDARERNDFIELSSRVISAAAAAKIEAKLIESDDEEYRYISLSIPSARSAREISLDTADELRSILEIDLEGISYLEGLDAVCDYKNGLVEVGLEPVSGGSPGVLERRFFRSQSGEERREELILSPPDGRAFRIGPASSLYKSLSYRYRYRGITLSMGISDLHGHDNILSELNMLANSLFLQIDLLFNQPISLARARSSKSSGEYFRRKPINLDLIRYPRHEYDSAPCALYWYGRAAIAMPLLQFLAYYQVVEYFYPIYSRSEINRRLRIVLNDPSFRPERDSDIAKVISSLSVNRSGGFLDERSQLKAVINECITSNNLHDFFESDDTKAEFFRKDYKSLHEVKVPVGQRSVDLRSIVAERLYGIRCRIVHTKVDGTDELGILLPYSDEESSMSHDIDLMQFVARSVLSTSGSILQ